MEKALFKDSNELQHRWMHIGRLFHKNRQKRIKKSLEKRAIRASLLYWIAFFLQTLYLVLFNIGNNPDRYFRNQFFINDVILVENQK